jgi:hypothetical protein
VFVFAAVTVADLAVPAVTALSSEAMSLTDTDAATR